MGVITYKFSSAFLFISLKQSSVENALGHRALTHLKTLETYQIPFSRDTSSLSGSAKDRACGDRVPLTMDWSRRLETETVSWSLLCHKPALIP